MGLIESELTMPDYRTTPSRSETGIARATTALALAVTLAGCAAQSGGQATRHSEPTFMRLTEERVFGQALRQRYLELATNAYDRADFSRSDFYSLRSIMAVEGKLVEPAGAGGRSRGDLGAARGRLARSIESGARTGSPDLAARAQAAYDCWWLESQSGGDSTISQACAFNAETALSELEVIGAGGFTPQPPAAPRRVVVNSNTPSQTINTGSATIEVINPRPAPAAARRPMPAPAPVAIPAAPVQTESYSQPPRSFAPLLDTDYTSPPAPIPFDTVQSAPSTEVPSLRTFVVEPEFFAGDTVVETVPIQDYTAPIELIPSYSDQTLDSLGGQYVATQPEAFTPATIQSQAYVAPPFYVTPPAQVMAPVYSETITLPQAAAPVMMDQSGDVLSSLVNARAAGSSDFSVYFGFDSDEITPEGADVLADTVEQLKLEDRGTVSLMGFTDSAGDSRYNQLLAMRRANAVRSYIQQRAGRPVRFEIMPVGEAEAVRDGGDGVTQALNRRVEIILR